MSHLLIWGNAYAQIIRNGKGEVLSLYPLLPNKMSVERDSNGVLYYVYSRYTDENPNMKKMGDIILRQEDVLHIPGLGFDGLIGYSPIAMARNAVGMTMACEEYGVSFFANGANPGGVLEHPGVLKDPAKVRDSWNAVYRGTTNAHKIAVLEEGMKYQQIGIPPEEAQFLETRKFQINEIARLFRIPPHMVGDLEKSSFSNIEQQSLEFVKYTLDPWVIRWEQALKKSLFLPEEKKEFFIKLNVDGLLRGDYQSRMNGYAIGRQNGWLSTNDIREMEDMNPLPESRSISENCTWGIRRRFETGKHKMSTKRFLGYDTDETGKLVINRTQEPIVVRLYQEFMDGKTTDYIKRIFEREGVKNWDGGTKWQSTTLMSMLENEKYKGDALLQKSYTVDFLTKKRTQNKGEIQMFYVEDDHDAIISKRIWECVQLEIKRRKKYLEEHGTNSYSHRPESNPFASKIICGDCNKVFARKGWRSSTGVDRKVWQCSERYKVKGVMGCANRHVEEETLIKAYLMA